jgi:hypothetical protein
MVSEISGNPSMLPAMREPAATAPIVCALDQRMLVHEETNRPLRL